MTERGRRAPRQAADGYFVKNSGIRREGDSFVITIDERCTPVPRALRGEVRVRPEALIPFAYPIDRGAAHFWRPIAPSTPIEVTMREPDLSWRGTGYFDMNWGTVPLEATFSHWDWMRVDMGSGRSAIFYQTEETDGPGRTLSLDAAADGTISPFGEMATRHRLPKTLWRVNRGGWSQDGAPTVRRTLEDTPFYVRTELTTTLSGGARTAIQESLSLRRFRNPVVQCMLPFRMPRLA
ncbi:MAG: carotenoid 1,2-hydratase [Pseudomonadota bacterium]